MYLAICCGCELHASFCSLLALATVLRTLVVVDMAARRHRARPQSGVAATPLSPCAVLMQLLAYVTTLRGPNAVAFKHQLLCTYGHLREKITVNHSY